MFLHTFAEADGRTLEEKLANAARPLKGAFSIVGITNDTLFAIRDSHGFKPLSLAKLNGGYILASETAAFLDIEGAEWIEDFAARAREVLWSFPPDEEVIAHSDWRLGNVEVAQLLGLGQLLDVYEQRLT